MANIVWDRAINRFDESIVTCPKCGSGNLKKEQTAGDIFYHCRCGSRTRRMYYLEQQGIVGLGPAFAGYTEDYPDPKLHRGAYKVANDR